MYNNGRGFRAWVVTNIMVVFDLGEVFDDCMGEECRSCAVENAEAVLR